jgi:hypothetical protein
VLFFPGARALGLGGLLRAGRGLALTFCWPVSSLPLRPLCLLAGKAPSLISCASISRCSWRWRLALSGAFSFTEGSFEPVAQRLGRLLFGGLLLLFRHAGLR